MDDETVSETLWRARAWDTSYMSYTETRGTSEAKGFHRCMLESLRALDKMIRQKGDPLDVDKHLQQARHVTMQDVASHELQVSHHDFPRASHHVNCAFECMRMRACVNVYPCINFSHQGLHVLLMLTPCHEHTEHEEQPHRAHQASVLPGCRRHVQNSRKGPRP
jgi:hypothetical protein